MSKKPTLTEIMEATFVNENNDVITVNIGSEKSPLEIEIKTRLSLKDIRDMENEIAETVITDNGEYYPSMMDFAIKYCLTSYFTNIKLGTNINKLESWFNTFDVVKFLSQYVDENYIHNIISQSIALIEFRKTSYKGKFQPVIDSLKSVFDSFAAVVEGIDVDGITQAIEDTIKQTAEEAAQDTTE